MLEYIRLLLGPQVASQTPFSIRLTKFLPSLRHHKEKAPKWLGVPWGTPWSWSRGWFPKAPGATGFPLPTCLPVLSWAPPPRKINDAGKHQVCCIYMMHIAPYSPSIVLWCMTKLPICQTLNSSQDNLFSTHSQSFSFCTTVTENSLGIFHLERMEKGEQKHPSAPPSPVSHTAPAHWGGNRPVPEHHPLQLHLLLIALST